MPRKKSKPSLLLPVEIFNGGLLFCYVLLFVVGSIEMWTGLIGCNPALVEHGFQLATTPLMFGIGFCAIFAFFGVCYLLDQSIRWACNWFRDQFLGR